MCLLCFFTVISLPVFTLSLLTPGQRPGHATEADFLRLYNKLLYNSSRHMRPISNQSAAIDVRLDFSLLSIFDVDDVKQQISVMAMITVQWVDKNLIWNPADYGGINRMFFKQWHIWTPEVYVESGRNSVTLVTLPTQHAVRSGGLVTFTSVGNVESPCSLDLTIFPYDKQTCKFGFGVLDSTVKEVNLSFGAEGVTKSKGFVEDGEWSVYGTGSDVVFRGDGDELYGTAHAVLKIKRRSTYYIINIIVPAVAIAILSLLTFGVPVESGERLAYALTILLSLSVYITYIGSIMPMSSVNMPIIFYLLLGLFMISSMCVVLTVLVIAIRWSHVIAVKENEKTILIFGIPFKIRRTHSRNYSTYRCCAWRFQHHKEEYKSSLENTSTWLPDRKELWEFENMKIYTLDNEAGDALSQRSLSFSPDGINKARSRTSIDDKLHVHLTEAPKLKDTPGATNQGGYDQTLDPDIIFICNRLNLYSFVALLLAFILMLSFTFVQFYHQVLPE